MAAPSYKTKGQLQQTSSFSKGKVHPDYPKAKDETYMLMRFKEETADRVSNACKREASVLRNYGGQVIGMAKTVNCYEGLSWPRNCGVLVILFSSMKQAERWLFSDTVFKQKDFPSPCDDLDIILLPLRYLPPRDSNIFQITWLKDVDDTTAIQRYINCICPMMDKLVIQHGVVATDSDPKNEVGVVHLRGSWPVKNSYFILIQYPDEHTFSNFYMSGEHMALKNDRDVHCNPATIVFTLESLHKKRN